MKVVEITDPYPLTVGVKGGGVGRLGSLPESIVGFSWGIGLGSSVIGGRGLERLIGCKSLLVAVEAPTTERVVFLRL